MAEKAIGKKKRFRLEKESKKYDIGFVLDQVDLDRRKNDPGWQIVVDEVTVSLTNPRLKLFKIKGTNCTRCGIEGKYFRLKKGNKKSRWSFVLYAVDEEGKEREITRDHIIPLAHGGRATFDNLVPMCKKCNIRKGAEYYRDKLLGDNGFTKICIDVDRIKDLKTLSSFTNALKIGNQEIFIVSKMKKGDLFKYLVDNKISWTEVYTMDIHKRYAKDQELDMESIKMNWQKIIKDFIKWKDIKIFMNKLGV